MAMTWEGGEPTKPQLRLDGNKVIVENVGVYDGSIPTTYRREVTYHFNSIDEAMEYYYKKR